MTLRNVETFALPADNYTDSRSFTVLQKKRKKEGQPIKYKSKEMWNEVACYNASGLKQDPKTQKVQKGADFNRTAKQYVN